MNKRGELEIAINKRLLERAFFILIIAVLGFLLFRASNHETDGVASVSVLEEQLQERDAQIEYLQQQLIVPEEPAEAEIPEEPEPEEPVAVPAPTRTDKVEYSWEVEGQLLTPALYNAEKIEELETEIVEYEEELDDDPSDERESVLEDKIQEAEQEITELKRGESRYKLEHVFITVENGKADPVVVDYALCWPQIECSQSVTKGTINVPADSTETLDVPLTIVKTIMVDKSKQTLRLVLKQQNKEIFKEDYVITV